MSSRKAAESDDLRSPPPPPQDNFSDIYIVREPADDPVEAIHRCLCRVSLVIRNLISFINAPEGNERARVTRLCERAQEAPGEKKKKNAGYPRGLRLKKSSRSGGRRAGGGAHARLQFNQSVPEVVCTSREPVTVRSLAEPSSRSHGRPRSCEVSKKAARWYRRLVCSPLVDQPIDDSAIFSERELSRLDSTRMNFTRALTHTFVT